MSPSSPINPQESISQTLVLAPMNLRSGSAEEGRWDRLLIQSLPLMELALHHQGPEDEPRNYTHTMCFPSQVEFVLLNSLYCIPKPIPIKTSITSADLIIILMHIRVSWYVPN